MKKFYAPCKRGGDLLFISGHLPSTLDGEMGEMTSQILDAIKALLHKEGLSMRNLVKVEVFLTDMGEFEAMNRAYISHFEEDFLPARTTVQVAALPKGARLEIAAIASFTAVL